MFRIEMLPARQGDCLWIEYGDVDSGGGSGVQRVLIDGGVVGTYRALRDKIAALPAAERRLELLVVTHVDRDHIEGIVKLLGDTDLGLVVDQIWYNGWTHVEQAADMLGTLQGEFLSALVRERGIPWNTSFGGGPVMVTDGPRRLTLDGGLEIALLSPDVRGLAALRDLWIASVEEKNLDPGDTDAVLAYLREERRELVPRDLLGPGDRIGAVDELAERRVDADKSLANASSIAFLAAYGGRSCLFAGDAPPEVLTPALLCQGLDALGLSRLDAWKLAHHGSKKSTSLAQLSTVAADRYLISTDGSYYSHPDDELIARVAVSRSDADSTLVFHTPLPDPRAELWNDPDLQRRFRYTLRVDPVVEL